MIWTSWEVMTIAVNFSTQVLLLATANCVFPKDGFLKPKIQMYAPVLLYIGIAPVIIITGID